MIKKPYAIILLLFAATMFASNHVAARLAFDNGTGLVLAIVFRATLASILMFLLALNRKQSFRITKEFLSWVLLVGVLISLQSLTLYSAIAVMPVAVALLLLNAWPILYIFASWWVGETRPNISLIAIMLVICLGLSLVLDLPSVLLGRTTEGSGSFLWWKGAALALSSAFFLAGAMWITNHKLSKLPGTVRSAYSMFIVAVMLLNIGLLGLLPSGFSLPESNTGYVGLLLLGLFYGIASCILFVLAPRLDMAKNSPVLNFEPVASLFLAYIFLGQMLSVSQLMGGGLVMVGIVSIGLLRAR